MLPPELVIQFLAPVLLFVFGQITKRVTGIEGWKAAWLAAVLAALGSLAVAAMTGGLPAFDPQNPLEFLRAVGTAAALMFGYMEIIFHLIYKPGQVAVKAVQSNRA